MRGWISDGYEGGIGVSFNMTGMNGYMSWLVNIIAGWGWQLWT